MNENDISLYNGCLVMTMIGGICYFYVMVYKAVNVIKGLFMNIFGGGSSGGSKRVRCDGSDSELAAVKARDVFAGLVKDGHESENFGEQVDASYEIEAGDRVQGGDHMVYKVISDGSVEAAFESNKNHRNAQSKNYGITSNEESMRHILSSLCNTLTLEKVQDDTKWVAINIAYCQLSLVQGREKAEVLRKYFRKLDTVFKRKNGSTYSKVVSADKAQGIIEELIEVYPWDFPIKVEPVKKEIEKRNNEIDELKGSVSDLMNVIAQINDRLDKIK